MPVCPNQIQTNKPLSLFLHGPITAPISLLFRAKFPQTVVSTWCLKQIEESKLKQRLTESIQTKAKITVKFIETSVRGIWNPLNRSNIHIIEIPKRERKYKRNIYSGKSQIFFNIDERHTATSLNSQKKK